jgi:hypothetical protein
MDSNIKEAMSSPELGFRSVDDLVESKEKIAVTMIANALSTRVFSLLLFQYLTYEHRVLNFDELLTR